MGVPLINAIYEKNPLVGLYTLPLLIWHPMQLVLGSFLSPKLCRWVEQEQLHLGVANEHDKEEERAEHNEAAASATASHFQSNSSCEYSC